jgi:uncharacterized membrane protein
MIVLVAITAIAAFFRLWNSGLQSLRLDEGFSIRWASWPLFPVYHGKTMVEPSLWLATASDVHPPGYLLLLHFWMQRFGTDIMTLRLPSELAGVLCIPALYLLGTSLYTRGIALIACFIGALSPLWIWHSQEARMYPFLLLFTILSTYGLVQAFEYRRWWGWPILFVFSLASIYTQYYAFMILLAHGLYLVTHMRQYTIKQLIGWVVTMALVAAAFLPWALTLLHNYHGASDPSLQHPNLYTPLNILVGFLFGYLTQPITSQVLAAWPLLVLICLALTVFGGAATRRGSLLWLLFLTPVVAAFVISIALRPFISERYLIVSTPALYILIGVVLVRLRGWLPRLLILAALAVSLIGSWHIAETSAANPNIEDFKSAAGFIDRHAGPNDVVALDSFFNQDAFSYYLHNNLPLYALPSLPQTNGVPPKISQSALASYTDQIETGHAHLWVVYYLETNYDPNNLTRQYLAYHTANHHVIIGGPYGRNDVHYPGSYNNVQLIEYDIIPSQPKTQQLRPETIQEYRALTNLTLSLRTPFASPFGPSGTIAAYNGEPLSMPAPHRFWQLSALPDSADNVHLNVFNPNQYQNDVWVQFQTDSGIVYKHLIIKPLSNMDVNLSDLGPTLSHTVVGLCTTTKSQFVPSRTMTSGGTSQLEYATALTSMSCHGQ